MNVESALQMFFEEAADLLRDFEEGLLRLESAPADKDVINRVFRSAHTIKGTSGMLGLDAIARFTHVLEDLLMRLRKGELAASRPIVDTLLASGDVLRGLLEAGRTGGDIDEPRMEGIMAALQAHARGETPSPAPAAPAAAAATADAYTIRFVPPPDLLTRGLDPIRLLDTLEDLGTISDITADTTRLPSLAELDPETAYLGFRCTLRTTRPVAAIENVFEFVGDRTAVTVEVCGSGGAGSVSAAGAPAADGLEDRRSGRDRRAPGADGSGESATIRVPTAKVDRLINLVGELVVTQSMVAQLVTRFSADRLGQLQEAVAQMDRHARDLQERVMAVRMLPIRTVFSRFPRLVRDLAQANGKEVALERVGEDTELDKTVIERISDPLTHLVRNAVDHGIEPPDVRVQAGKRGAGRLTLRAYQQGGNIYIEVADDGRGLQRERIVAKAVELGLIEGDDALTDHDVWALIFRPGFSTAARVTQVSGRGVGMDVVARNVEALGGSITIHTEPGRGTTFRVKLPLTLAILDGQLLRVGDAIYILPLVSIVESVRPRRSDLNTLLGDTETVTIRREVMSMIRLHRVFDVAPSTEDPTTGLVVIVEHDGRRVALLVDELLGQQQVVIKSLETNFQRTEGIAGATILGDGRVALILDVPGLVALARSRPRLRDDIPGKSFPAHETSRRLAHRS
ncbi:MAG TPA: chemotaxis protein CheA [Methylomirabilota bacterium]